MSSNKFDPKPPLSLSRCTSLGILGGGLLSGVGFAVVVVVDMYGCCSRLKRLERLLDWFSPVLRRLNQPLARFFSESAKLEPLWLCGRYTLTILRALLSWNALPVGIVIKRSQLKSPMAADCTLLTRDGRARRRVFGNRRGSFILGRYCR